MAREGDGGFNEGIVSFLPSRRVLDQVQKRHHGNRENIHRFKDHSDKFPKQQQQPKSSLRSNNNIRPTTTRPPPTNWALSGGGGHGMQAIFLDSSYKSSGGTGVFLPRNFGKDKLPSKRPGCSPVLLPSRVVHALNLNVHDLGLQISPRPDQKNIAKSRDHSSSNNKVGKDNASSSPQCCVISQKQSASPEIFLPKEWTY